MNAPDMIGLLAGVLTSINIIPQIIQSVRTKRTEDISLPMFVIYDVGLFLWVVYGWLINSLPIIIMDGFAFISSLFMTLIKVKYQRTDNRSS